MPSTATPDHFRKLQVVQHSHDFRAATRIVEGHLEPAVPAGHVQIRVIYAGVNASDSNYTAGGYFSRIPTPYDCGYEALGPVIAVGPDVTNIKKGDIVVSLNRCAFAEFVCVAASQCTVVPSLDPKYTGLFVSGMTAAISIGELGKPKKGETALVTAAAGGTGQIAVQLLKHVYGCTVIGTCSNEEKAAYLKSIGCDHVIDYKKEDLETRLSELAPKGLDVVYECVGGDVFSTAVHHMAVHGRLILIGAITSYLNGEIIPYRSEHGESLNMQVILKAITISGFFLSHSIDKVPQYMPQLLGEMAKGGVKVTVDKTEFKGVEQIADAVEHLYSSKSFGKVVVRIQDP